MKKSILLLLVFATVLCFSASADTYTWALQQGWAWDTNIVWNPADVANSNKYPNARDDVAIINTLTLTNSSGVYQMWPNQFGHIYTTIGEWWLNMTNELIFGAGDASSFNAMVFQTTNEQAKLMYNNLFIDESDPYWWWNHILNLRFATSYILSNDLILFAEGPVDSYGDKDSAVIWLVTGKFLVTKLLLKKVKEDLLSVPITAILMNIPILNFILQNQFMLIMEQLNRITEQLSLLLLFWEREQIIADFTASIQKTELMLTSCSTVVSM